MTIAITASNGVEAHFQTVCDNPDNANTFAALLQAGLLFPLVSEWGLVQSRSRQHAGRNSRGSLRRISWTFACRLPINR